MSGKSKKLSLATNADLKRQLTQNMLLERKLWIQRLLDPRRDIDKECGYPEVLLPMDYYNLYLRGDIAARVVRVWPEESWAEDPAIYEMEDQEETNFEKAWKDLNDSIQLLSHLQRADILSGIGRFGVMLLGTDDGLDLSQPLPGIDETGKQVEGRENLHLIYIRCFEETHVSVISLQTDNTNPRFGLPQMYQIGFQDLAVSSNITTNKQVHWSRVIHLADNRIDSDVYGVPRMQPVINRILDVRKIAGGSGEMFWKGGFPGLSLETLPGVVGNNVIEIDTESTKKQMEAYMNGLQRYIATIGMTTKSLTVQVADPTPHANLQVMLIAAALGIPHRIFVGSEAAQLASQQDSVSWLRRLTRRRRQYLTPHIILPTLQRLITVGILPKPENIIVGWPDLYSPSQTEKAEVAQQKGLAISQYVASGADTLISPFHFFTLILGMTNEEAQAVLDHSVGELEKVDGADVDEDGDAGGSGNEAGAVPNKPGPGKKAKGYNPRGSNGDMLGEEGNRAQGGGEKRYLQ